MRPETGLAVLETSSSLAPSPDGPSLTSLLDRIVASRLRPVAVAGAAGVVTTPEPTRRAIKADEAGAALRVPAPGLVGPPAQARRISAGGVVPTPVSTVSLVAAHGGAGVTSLLRAGLDGPAVDAGRVWPSAGRVVLVARTSTWGVEWARDLARQHASGAAGLHVELLGLVLVADAPGRLPARIADQCDLVRGAFPRTWSMPWLEEWRLASQSQSLPVPPDVQRLTAEITDLARLPGRPRTFHRSTSEEYT